MHFPLSTEVLEELFRLLPDDESRRLRALDPDDYQTHVAAYLAIRRHGDRIPHRIRVAVVSALFAFHDRAASEVVEPPG